LANKRDEYPKYKNTSEGLDWPAQNGILPVELNQKIFKQEHEEEYWCNETNCIIRPYFNSIW